MRTALDSNVLSALWSNEAQVSPIPTRLANYHAQGGLVVCGPVYVELLAHPAVNQDFVDTFLSETGISVDFHLEEQTWRAAAKGFAEYAHRRRASGGGSPKRLLVDFVVGAHALLRADRLMTLDPARYKVDFPTLLLV
ncbi:MAG: type II toxin-antitoxin system VapC family toxin [Candidatus Sulfotelmatobacter sp.]